MIPQHDVEEDTAAGEINPYTGREYQSNSVRMHPTRIGYVQVYDRAIHKWTDMTEWAFLGLQERKKALLGKRMSPRSISTDREIFDRICCCTQQKINMGKYSLHPAAKPAG